MVRSAGAPSWGRLQPKPVQWSAGEYTNASNQQDDIKIITTQNGFGFRPDLFGTRSAARRRSTQRRMVPYLTLTSTGSSNSGPTSTSSAWTLAMVPSRCRQSAGVPVV